MPVQQNSRTDWRYRVVQDPNWRRTTTWLLTDPGFNTTPGDQDFPAIIPGAFQLANKYGIAARAQFEVTGSGISLLSLDKPFIPPVWENPKGYQRSVELLTWIQTRTSEYDAEEVKPFHQDDWPVPRGYPFTNSNRGFATGTPPLLLAFPFNQYDWPVPKGYPFPLQNRGFVSGTHPLLLAIPFNQFDWPVPRGYPFPLEDRGYIHPSFPAILQPPFAQLHWPVPKGYPYPINLRFLGPQVFHYIYERAGFGTISDTLADGFRIFDIMADGGTLSDAFADGWRISDAYADGATIEDELSNGGILTDGH